MGDETNSSNTTMLHTAEEGEEPAVEEEIFMNKFLTTLAEKLKNVAITEAEKLKTVTPAEEGEEESKKIKLKTTDGVIFEVEPCIVKEMEMVQSFIDAQYGGDAASVVISLPLVASRELRRIIEYTSEHCRGTGNLKEFDVLFVAALSDEELMDLLMAANLINLKMRHFLVENIVDMFLRVKFIRNFLSLNGSSTSEEEDEEDLLPQAYAKALLKELDDADDDD